MEQGNYLLVKRTLRGGMVAGAFRVLVHDDIEPQPLTLGEARLSLSAECYLHAMARWEVDVQATDDAAGFRLVAKRDNVRRVVRAVHADMVEQLGLNPESN